MILYAIPFFFLLIGIELLMEWLRKTNYYRLNDAINSLSLGVLSQMFGLAKRLIPLGMYYLVFQHVALFDIPQTPVMWVVAFILFDLCYYWFHRTSHEVNLFWAAHVVHHSSEEYNLTTALRQTSGALFSWIFYLPLAVLGFDPVMVGTVGALNLIYQFWVHSRHIPKLGWFEWFFVSPSNHRVHHAQNDIYLDKNYGGVFIVWDRMFGTFQEELDEPEIIYGVRGGLHSWNPLWANLHVYRSLLRDCWCTKSWRDKLRVWFKPPGWRPADVAERFGDKKVDLSQFQKFDIALSKTHKWYCLLQHILHLFIGLVFLVHGAKFSLTLQLAGVAFVVACCVSLGTMLEAKPFAKYVELVKHGSFILGSLLVPLPIWFSVSVTIGCVISLLLLYKIRGESGAPPCVTDTRSSSV